MVCWIQVVHGPDAKTVQLAGHLTAPHVCNLLSVCSEASAIRVRLDLHNLISVDPVGLHALRRLRSEGAELVGIARDIEQKLGLARRWVPPPSPR